VLEFDPSHKNVCQPSPAETEDWAEDMDTSLELNCPWGIL